MNFHSAPLIALPGPGKVGPGLDDPVRPELLLGGELASDALTPLLLERSVMSSQFVDAAIQAQWIGLKAGFKALLYFT